MAKSKIINPNSDILSNEEKEFISENRSVPTPPETKKETKDKTRTRSISMLDSLYYEMEQFLIDFPVERSRSSIIHRAVKDYMEKIRKTTAKKTT
jgi:hypothetical protein